MFNFAMRNLKIFFRQKSSVFFSLLGVFVIIVLYMVFLGDVWKSGNEQLPDIDALMNCWIIAGIVSVASITTVMGAFGVMVEDKENRISKDFLSSPISRTTMVGGYLLSSYIIAIIMSIVSFVVGAVYLYFANGVLFSLITILKMIGVLLIGTTASSALVFFIISFLSNSSAFSTASTVLGTLIGFLTGIYLPVGDLPQGVQMVVKCFPISHTTALMRQVLMQDSLAENFKDIPAKYEAEFKEFVGVTFTYGDYTASALLHIGVLVATALLFFALAVFNASQKRKNVNG